MKRSLLLATAVGVATAGSLAWAAIGPDTSKLRNAVSAESIMVHLHSLQAIADAHGGGRASGTPGYDASADYVQAKLEAAGYTVTRQPFDFLFFRELAEPIAEQISPTAATFDVTTFEYSPPGDVTAPLQAVDARIDPSSPPSTSNSGCEASDFAGFAPGNIALIQRGTCTFHQKVANAAAAGAAGVIIFNEGQPGRTDVINGTLGEPTSIPAVGMSTADGAHLLEQLAAGEVVVRVATFTESETRQTFNVIAETKGGRDDRIVVVGAHLDSVPEGPGINDNGSGTAVILETAIQMARLQMAPTNKVRFIFWGAEESGLLGAEHYVSHLSKEELKKIALNLNFDMLGSPNYVRFVYDGDGSAGGPAGPNGSENIEKVFLDYFASKGLASAPTAFDGRSDYGPFIAAGIPAGGLFTGAEGAKTEEQARIYGGTAGVAYDPCYHSACDDISNLSQQALEEMGDATAHAVLTFAMTKSAVNGTAKASDQAVVRAMDYKGSHLQR